MHLNCELLSGKSKLKEKNNNPDIHYTYKSSYVYGLLLAQQLKKECYNCYFMVDE